MMRDGSGLNRHDEELRRAVAAAVYEMAAVGGKNVLDLTRDGGVLGAMLSARRGMAVTYVDDDAAHLARAGSAGLRRVIEASPEGLEWTEHVAGETFDVVLLADLPSRLAESGLLMETVRDLVLSDAAFGVIAVPNVASAESIAALLDSDPARGVGLLDSEHLRFFTERSLRRFAEAHGFAVTRLVRIPGRRRAERALTVRMREHLAASAGDAAMLVARVERLDQRHVVADLHERIRALEDERDRLREEIARARRGEDRRYQEATELFRARRLDLEALLKMHRQELARIRGSRSWKIARVITGASRSFRRARRAPAEPTVAPTVARTRGPVTKQPPPTPVAPPQAPPKLSIVIPVYNGFAVTRRCIESIYDSPSQHPFEIVVVDNASHDGVTDWLREQARARPRLRLIANELNFGFGGGVNVGVEAAGGEYILICNSDVIIPQGALDRLIAQLDEHPDLGIVSPVTNYVGEGPQLDREAADVTPETVAEHAARVAARPQELQDVPDRLVFFCVLVRRALFTLLGGLSEEYGLGNFEDDDLCVRARLAGYRLGIDRSAFVFHHGSASFDGAKISHTGWMERNRRIYYDRLAELSTTLIPRPKLAAVSPEVSVIVRTVNRPRWLVHALTSLANQTFRDFEVVLVNDGGPILADVLAAFEPHLHIRYVEHDRPLGRTAALNAGLLTARGTFITYLDDDDVAYPTHLEVLVRGMLETGYQVAYSDAHKLLCEQAGPGEVVLAREPFGSFEFDRKELLVRNPLPIMSFMHAAECLKVIGMFDEQLDVLEDWDFLIRLSREFPFYHVRRITSEYRFRFSGTLENTIVSQREHVYQTHRAIYERYPADDEDLQERRRVMIESARAQMEEIRSIQAEQDDEAAKSFQIMTTVTGFKVDPR